MPPIRVVPQPKRVVYGEGTWSPGPQTAIHVSPAADAVGRWLGEWLRPATGWDLPVELVPAPRAAPGAIILSLTGSHQALGEEGYQLQVTPAGVAIRAPQPAGLFYGVQTLRQLWPPEVERGTSTGVDWALPVVEITDAPRFSWRGLHLDVGRHMFAIAQIKRMIDLIAMHKMNAFHWHLTDDQGWRIEIEGHPKLTEVGAWRAATPLPGDRHTLDGTPYGGFYTQAEVRDVVAYAADRAVTVVPEIEMPGHALAALAAYPELGCTGGPYEVRTRWGVEPDVFCAGKEEVFAFLEDVLSQVIDLFPSEVVHIGGDECPKDRWQSCPACQARIAAEGLADEHELQSYFIRRIGDFLRGHRRRMIGWDEILEGGLAPNAMVMSWRGSQGGIDAALAGHDVVMTPNTYCYLDYYQAEDRTAEPPAIGGHVPLEQVYAFEPVPAELTDAQAQHILGLQGNLWTEYIPTVEQLEYMAFPRASALAEVGWSDPAGRDFAEFRPRLERLLERLRLMGVNYRALNPLL